MDGFDDSVVTWFSFRLLLFLMLEAVAYLICESSRKTFSSFLFLLRSAYLQVTCILVSSLLCGRRNLYQLSCRLVSTDSAGTWLLLLVQKLYLICMTPVSIFFLIGWGNYWLNSFMIWSMPTHFLSFLTWSLTLPYLFPVFPRRS